VPKSEVFSLHTPLPLARARQIIQAALGRGRERTFMPLTVVVLDSGGHMIAMEREDGAGVVRQQVAAGKAWGALGIGVGSRTVGARNQGRDAFMAGVAAASDGQFIPVPGGVLVIENGEAIGAVGVSGDTSDADEECAIAGIEAAGYRAGVDTPD
jgi:uncharacterized protein GlcG (DUF336 family)